MMPLFKAERGYAPATATTIAPRAAIVFLFVNPIANATIFARPLSSPIYAT